MCSLGRLDDLDDAALAALQEALRHAFPVIGADPITGLDQGFGATVLFTAKHAFDPTLIHGDAWYGNMLVDAGGELSAVLDWEAADADDPARDLARQMHLGRDAGFHLLSIYRDHRRTDSGFEHRMRRQWELVELGGLSWCLQMDDDAELRDCLRNWRAGPVLSSWW